MIRWLWDTLVELRLDKILKNQSRGLKSEQIVLVLFRCAPDRSNGAHATAASPNFDLGDDAPGQ
jgi:hypothetical protein